MNSPGNKREYIEKNGVYLSAPQGDSMKPFIRGDRDVVAMKRIERPLKKYDVILYEKEDGRSVIHRILKIEGDLLFVRGDNTFYRENVKREDVLAVMDYVLLNGRKKARDTGLRGAAVRLWRVIYPLRRLLHGAKRRISRFTGEKKSGRG